MHPFARPNTEIDVERYTPPEIVAAVRETLGSIDLDPCTTPLVNGTFIRASHYYTRENNGLDRERMPWAGRVYINPPSYIENNGQQRNSPQLFWERLVIEYEQKRVTAGVFLAFNLEHLQQSQNWNRTMLQWPFCIPSKRLTFWREKGGKLESREHPEFASAVIYVGRSVKRFAKAFEGIGTVVIPRIANPRTISMQTGLTAPPIEGCERDPQPNAEDNPGVNTPARINREISEATGIHLNADEACRIATTAEEKLTTIDSLRKKGHTINWDCPICKGMPRQARCAYIKTINVNIDTPGD